MYSKLLPYQKYMHYTYFKSDKILKNQGFKDKKRA